MVSSRLKMYNKIHAVFINVCDDKRFLLDARHFKGTILFNNAFKILIQSVIIFINRFSSYA